MPQPRPHTNAKLILDIMNICLSSGERQCVSDIQGVHGETIPRTSLSMYINKLTKEHFPGFVFYTRTDRHTNKLFLGCYPENQQ